MRPAIRPLAARAPRYPLVLPCRLRPAGEQAWTSTTTHNVSRTGVLLFVDPPGFEPGAVVDVALELSAGDVRGGIVEGTGLVVRCTRVSGRAAVAAALDRFDLSAPDADLHGA